MELENGPASSTCDRKMMDASIWLLFIYSNPMAWSSESSVESDKEENGWVCIGKWWDKTFSISGRPHTASALRCSEFLFLVAVEIIIIIIIIKIVVVTVYMM